MNIEMHCALQLRWVENKKVGPKFYQRHFISIKFIYNWWSGWMGQRAKDKERNATACINASFWARTTQHEPEKMALCSVNLGHAFAVRSIYGALPQGLCEGFPISRETSCCKVTFSIWCPAHQHIPTNWLQIIR